MAKAKEEKIFRKFEFKIEGAEESKDTAGNPIGLVSGYASTFGNIDQGMDIVERGAFAKTIKDKGGRFPILLDHNPSKPIGWNLEASEDAYGLHVKGEIQLVTEDAINRYRLAKRALEINAKSGLSIGYSVIKAEPDFDKPMIRRLKELKLWEYSFVVFPMNEEANLTDVKNSQKLLDQLLGRGYSEEEIQAALLAIQKKKQEPPAVSPDPKLLQSVDDIIKILKSR